MKRLITKLFAVGMLISAAAFMFTSCTKEGPQGPAGPAGKDGTNGQDANATCTQCHNFSDSIVAKIFQYDASQHATGSTAFENRKTCAPCHTSQGYIEIVATGADTTLAEVTDPAPINCRTCHNIHATYTSADWAIKTTAPYNLRINKSITMDFQGNGGSGNLCGRCHQARTTSPWVTNPVGTDSLKITSMRWGPHYGGQSLILGARGAFEFGVPFGGNNSAHKNEASCTSCHGAKAVGNLTGGHSLWIGNEEEGDNLFGCNIAACHDGEVTATWMENKQASVEAKLLALQDALIAKQIIDSVTHYVLVPKKYTQKQMAVVWNYKLVYYDRSTGMHNYSYTNDLLDASLAAINE
jgi:hypothetical protein